MNKAQKKRRLESSPFIAVSAVLLLRILMPVICAAAAFASDDPGAFVDGAAYSAKLICEFFSGMIIARAVGFGFSRSTKLTLAVAASVILNLAELFIGKAISGGAPSGAVLIPIAAVVCAIGAMLASRRRGAKRRKKARR